MIFRSFEWNSTKWSSINIRICALIWFPLESIQATRIIYFTTKYCVLYILQCLFWKTGTFRISWVSSAEPCGSSDKSHLILNFWCGLPSIRLVLHIHSFWISIAASLHFRIYCFYYFVCSHPTHFHNSCTKQNVHKQSIIRFEIFFYLFVFHFRLISGKKIGFTFGCCIPCSVFCLLCYEGWFQWTKLFKCFKDPNKSEWLNVTEALKECLNILWKLPMMAYWNASGFTPEIHKISKPKFIHGSLGSMGA